jgi:hypothetical protein
MSRLDELLNLARERGFDAEWELRKIHIIAFNLGISPERIANDVLDREERTRQRRYLRSKRE